MKKLIPLLFIMLMTFTSAMAQSIDKMVVKMTAGDSTVYSVADLADISFGGNAANPDKVALKFLSGQTVSYDVANILEITFSGQRISFNIPEGALKSDVTLMGEVLNVNSFEWEMARPVMGAFDVLKLTPEGTTFNKPIQVSVDMDNAPKQETLGVYCYDETQNCWVAIGDATVKGKQVTFSAEHFSLYAFSYITMSDLAYFDVLAKRAYENETSPQSVADEFLRYIVGTKNVMETYRTFALGQYYLPFNCIVKGGYDYKGFHSGDLMASYSYDLRRSPEFPYNPTDKFRQDIVSGLESLMDTYIHIVDGEEKDKRENQEMFSKMVDIDYDMCIPQIVLSQDCPISEKGETCDMTIDMHVNDEYEAGTYYVCVNQKLTVESSNSSEVSVSTGNVTLDDDGKAHVTLTAMKDEPNADIIVKYSYHDDFDDVDTQSKLEIRNDVDWEMVLNVQERRTGLEGEIEGYMNFDYQVRAYFSIDTIDVEGQKGLGYFGEAYVEPVSSPSYSPINYSGEDMRICVYSPQTHNITVTAISSVTDNDIEKNGVMMTLGFTPDGGMENNIILNFQSKVQAMSEETGWVDTPLQSEEKVGCPWILIFKLEEGTFDLPPFYPESEADMHPASGYGLIPDILSGGGYSGLMLDLEKTKATITLTKLKSDEE